jgi:hypothetical protein
MSCHRFAIEFAARISRRASGHYPPQVKKTLPCLFTILLAMKPAISMRTIRDDRFSPERC